MSFLKVDYAEFKNFCQTREKAYPQLVDRVARAADGFFHLETWLDDTNLADFNTTFSGQINKSPVARDASGVPLSANETPSGDFDTIISHNFADKLDAERPWADPADSSFELLPPAGKLWTLEKSEVQFEHDLQISGVTKLFIDYYIWHPSFPATPVVGKTIELGSIRAIFELGNDHFHAPPINTEILTGMSTVQFNYRRSLKIYGDETPLELAKVVLRLDNHVEAGGSYATVGFVIVEADL